MAFTLQNWSRESVSANEVLITLQNGVVEGCYRKFLYTSPLDLQATVAASGYFNTEASSISTGDLIQVYSVSENTYITYSATNTANVITLANITSGGGVSSYVQVPLSNAQILGMYAAPVALVATPGAGKLILLDKFTLNLTFVNDAFAGGGVVAPQYDSTVHGAGTDAATTTIAASVFTGLAANLAISLTGLVANTATSGLINKGLWLSNQTAAFTNATTGASTGLANVWYRVVAAT